MARADAPPCRRQCVARAHPHHRLPRRRRRRRRDGAGGDADGGVAVDVG